MKTGSGSLLPVRSTHARKRATEISSCERRHHRPAQRIQAGAGEQSPFSRKIHTFGVHESGAVLCWGYNDYKQTTAT
ncbi:MAG TPA: hypothetical protein DIU15_13025 [Deltaproteobacteria bacterium]|nr:hypothetical protein [Deltaproteobacteria bacterium]HCP46962.1 hypothetical protein [Deltaproteobacteria bacterium]